MVQLGVGHGPVRGGDGPVDKAPGCCKVALGSNPRPSTPKMGSLKKKRMRSSLDADEI
jgi:hypothetical protein